MCEGQEDSNVCFIKSRETGILMKLITVQWVSAEISEHADKPAASVPLLWVWHTWTISTFALEKTDHESEETGTEVNFLGEKELAAYINPLARVNLKRVVWR